MAITTAPPTGTKAIAADILIVGGGFGGCYALYSLRKAGYSVKLIEAGSDFGGVWHFNSYPGARVDSEVPLYQLSIPEAWRAFHFKERFPDHVELRAYFAHMAKALDLRKDAIFNTRVVEARCDSLSGSWTLLTDNGVQATSQYTIFATGTTHKSYVPSFPGLNSFQGTIVHPCRWPSDLDIKGKKVGIIGQGCSGVQILQELAKEDADITVFVRNPPIALPMAQRHLTAAETEEQKNQYSVLFSHAKNNNDSGLFYDGPRGGYFETTKKEHERFWGELWARGSLAIMVCNYPEYLFIKEANAEFYQYWAKRVRARITDPIKRDIMAPLEQFQWLGTKRSTLEMDYYEMIDRPNVKLVSLQEHTIQTFTAEGVITTNATNEAASHDLDIVVMATGYDSVTGSLYEMNIHDNDGALLQDRWASSVQTYLGMVAPGLPNAFILYGPQAPSGLANGPPFIEMQVDWVVRFLAHLKEKNVSAFDVNPEVAKAYVQRNVEMYSQTLMKETPSWYNGANIPGKTKEILFWTRGLQAWRHETEDALNDSDRFEMW